ncbi:MAG: glycosyltransferase family 2 protein [Gemmataceae bacterium]
MSSLSIVIPTYNGLHHLKRCLPSVLQYAPSPTQVIVVDDASTDGTTDWVRSHFPEAELIPFSTNVGFCRAVNAGIDIARGDIVELLNNDTEVCAGWAEAALEHFQEPSVGSVAPLVLVMDADKIDSAGQNYHVCGWAQPRGYGRPVTPKYLTPQEVFGASGSSGFYRRAALNQVGGMLPEYDAYLEDTDLAFRLRWAGYRCVYEPTSRVYHRGSASYGKQSQRVLRWLSRNEELNFWTNLPWKQLLLGLPLHAAFVGIRCFRQALRGQLSAYLRGKWEAMKMWRWMANRRWKVQDLSEPEAKPTDIRLSLGFDVVETGWTWLRRRQCR